MKIKYVHWITFEKKRTLLTKEYKTQQKSFTFGLEHLKRLAREHLGEFELQTDSRTELANITGLTAVYSGDDPAREGECITTELVVSFDNHQEINGSIVVTKDKHSSYALSSNGDPLNDLGEMGESEIFLAGNFFDFVEAIKENTVPHPHNDVVEVGLAFNKHNNGMVCIRIGDQLYRLMSCNDREAYIYYGIER